MDGVDAVLIDIQAASCRTIAGLTHPYPADLNARLHAAIAPQARLSLHEFASLNVEVGECFAVAASRLLEQAGISATAVMGLGSHGQTLRHAPREAHPYSIQIGSPAVIAARTGITTVADFRAMDIAYGGQGAPLVPAFHEWLLRVPDENRIVANIGGIANITLLPSATAAPIHGYDTGPGNCLMDSWIARHQGVAFDANGEWAAAGNVHRGLLDALLLDDFYSMSPPKSTGREVFNFSYLDAFLARPAFTSIAPRDVQSTLAALTVETLAREIERQDKTWAARVLVCGGGAQNGFLMAQLANRLASIELASTATTGVDPDMLEASAFAWLAYMRLRSRPVRVTTGAASTAVLLGAIYAPTAMLFG